MYITAQGTKTCNDEGVYICLVYVTSKKLSALVVYVNWLHHLCAPTPRFSIERKRKTGQMDMDRPQQIMREEKVPRVDLSHRGRCLPDYPCQRASVSWPARVIYRKPKDTHHW